MDFIGKSNEEIIEELLELMDRGEKITVQDLVDAVSTRSVIDNYASTDAVTVFYSGETEDLINSLVKQAGNDVRIIRRTEAYDFLARDEFREILEYVVQQDNQGMLDVDVKKEVNRLLYEASSYESGIRKEGQGFWTVISRRFAAETIGDAYSLCGNAKPDRIFAR